jgi:hypothetical protein
VSLKINGVTLNLKQRSICAGKKWSEIKVRIVSPNG